MNAAVDAAPVAAAPGITPDFEKALIAQRAQARITAAERDALHATFVCAVVITYNSSKWAESCLRGLEAQMPDVRLRVIAVDNGSTDDTVAAFERHKGSLDLEFVRFPGNRGYAVACNAGIERALAAGADYVLILNPDVELLPGAVAETVLVERNHPGLGPISPVHIARDQPRVEPGCMWFLRLCPEFPRRVPADGRFERVYRMEYVNGSIMLLSRELLDAIGRFDELFFFYGEDNDLCRRSWHAGRPPAVATRAHGYHWHASYRGLDAFRRSNRRQANYQMILKKATRPFALNVGFCVAQFVLDHLREGRNRAELSQIWRDFAKSTRKLVPLYRSRRHDVACMMQARREG